MPIGRGRSNSVEGQWTDVATSRGRSNAVLLLNPQPKIWCPGIDVEMTGCAEKAIPALNLYHTLLEGGKRHLSAFSPESKLYILCHGHERMPMFTCNGVLWTAEQLAEMLEKDGLPKTQRVIELLVCHAGESVTTKEAWAAIKPARDEFIATKSSFLDKGHQGPLNKPATEYKAAFEKYAHIKPTHFENDPALYLLPLAAQLTQALKQKGYSNFMMISYKAPVAQVFILKLYDKNNKPFFTKPGVCLQVPDVNFNGTPRRHPQTPDQLQRKQPGDIVRNPFPRQNDPLVKNVQASSRPDLKAVWL